ncbi:MAG: hypothetical protein ACT4P5_01175 [Armatimonadota bacterium]
MANKPSRRRLRAFIILSTFFLGASFLGFPQPSSAIPLFQAETVTTGAVPEEFRSVCSVNMEATLANANRTPDRPSNSDSSIIEYKLTLKCDVTNPFVGGIGFETIHFLALCKYDDIDGQVLGASGSTNCVTVDSGSISWDGSVPNAFGFGVATAVGYFNTGPLDLDATYSVAAYVTLGDPGYTTSTTAVSTITVPGSRIYINATQTRDASHCNGLYSNVFRCAILSKPFTLANLYGRHFLVSQDKYYRACKVSSVGGRVGGQGYPYWFRDWVDGYCASDPAGPWYSVKLTFEFWAKDEEQCVSNEFSYTHVLHGYIRISGGPKIPAKLLAEVTPLGEFAPLVHVSVVDDVAARHSTTPDLVGNETSTGVLYDQSPYPTGNAYAVLETTLSYDTVVAAVLPNFSSDLWVRDVRAFRTPYISFIGPCNAMAVDFKFSGSIQEADSSTSEYLVPGVETHLGLAPVLDAVDTTADDGGQVVDEMTALNAMASLSALFNFAAAAQVPDTPFTPPFPYTIAVKYRDLLGAIREIPAIPAMFGVPQLVTLVGAPAGSNQFVVTLGSKNNPASVAGLAFNNRGFYLHIKRVDTTLVLDLVQSLANVAGPVAQLLNNLIPTASSCTTTPIDISANIDLQSVYAHAGIEEPEGIIPISFVSAGYQALTNGGPSADSPKEFAIYFDKTEGSGNQRVAAHVRSIPCGTPKPLSLVAGFKDGSGAGTDISLEAAMPSALASVDLAYVKDGSGKAIFDYRASGSMSSISMWGQIDGWATQVTLTSVPENMELCQHSAGDLCTVEWRRGRGSEMSISLGAWNSTGALTPLSVQYYKANPADPNDVTSANLSLSKLVADSKVGLDNKFFVDYGVNQLFGGVPANVFGPGKGYPYFVYLNTASQVVRGTYSSRGRQISANQGFQTGGIEWLLRKRWYGLRSYRHGGIDCGDLSFEFGSGGFYDSIEAFVRWDLCK